LKLAFFGSRSLRIRRKEVLKIIEMEIEKHNPEMVITSGAPEGVCKLVKYYCINNGITLKLYNLDFKRHARGAFQHRSISTIEDSDYVISIHDGESRGTKNEFNLVRRFGKLYTYHLLKIRKENIDANIDQFDIGNNLNELNNTEEVLNI